MQQVPEMFGAEQSPLWGRAKVAGNLVRCGIFISILTFSAGCGRREPHSANAGMPSQSRILNRGMPGEPRTLDPQLADDNFSFLILRDLYEGLTAENRDGTIAPGAASSWDIDRSGTTYSFHLRPDARWSDGRQIVAAEFVQGLRRAVDPKTGSGSAAVLSVIKGAADVIAGRNKVSNLGVAAVSDNLLRIELEHPAPYILQILSLPIAAPVHLQKALSSDLSQTQTKVTVSNGPYTLVNRVTGSFIELARNSNYWDASNVHIERVRYVNSESEATELREYTAGQLDMTFTIPMPDLKRVLQRYPDEVQTSPVVGTLFLALNLSEPRLRENTSVRQALSMAVDRDSIAKYVMMGATPAYALVAQGASGYVSPFYNWTKWTRERQLNNARDLMAQAGYSKVHPLRLKLYFNTGETIQRIMIAVAESWKKNLGVETELESDEFRVFLVGRKDRHHWDIVRIGWYADFDDASSFLELFTRNSNQNDPGYSNPTFDKLIDAARVEANPKARLGMLEQSEGVLMNDYPIVPIYFYQARRLAKPYLGGAAITPMNRTYSKHLFWKNQ